MSQAIRDFFYRLETTAEVSFWNNSVVRWLVGAAIVFQAIALGVLGWLVHPRGMPVIIHYNAYFGVDLLGVWWQAYLLPVIGSVLVLGHIVMGWLLYAIGRRSFSYLFLLGATFISFVVVIGSAALAYINY